MSNIASQASALRARATATSGFVLDQVSAEVTSLKKAVLAYNLAFLTSGASASGSVVTNAKIARDVYEAAAITAARAFDTQQFTRTLQLLRPYYSAVSVLGESDLRLPIIGLYLLALLSTEDLAQFHTELETLNESDLASPSVASVAELERSIAEGNYHRALAMRDVVPLANLNLPFFSLIEESVRRRVLECCAVAYPSLSTQRLATLLSFSNTTAAEAFVVKMGYIVSPGKVVTFQAAAPAPEDVMGTSTVSSEAARPGIAQTVPAHLLIEQMLSNATDIERIV